ncbi:DUF642 domain-containing protein [Pseudoalteromonas sp. DL2-H2.2]|uniref:DUF642 domain-containing protein n=1 Tax=Pseudoalteromonas sp. DL2-H2.2 TaxID=2908889 RepID=UPI001F1C63B6|nr:DUF642 domain-containing protein [Pseudoalteromonas sp. DL2-H2.2]MCF2910153.1 DUF642 domain-containing protein [Pseudoalteromonas sp. DL2-H2.2]
MKLSVLALGLSAALISSFPANASENLITNGSFEQSNAVNGSWSLFKTLPGWNRSSAKFEIQTNRLGLIQAQDGEQYLELDSTRNYSAYQSVATEAGKQYVVSFYYSPRVTNNNTTNKATVYWDDQVIAELNGTQRGWQHYTINVTASSDESTLKFVGAGNSDSYGALLDSVSVSADCVTGLFGINNYGSAEGGYVYYFDIDAGQYSKVSGVTHTASNIASKDGVLYFMEQTNSKTKASTLWALDLNGNQQYSIANTKSWPLYRSAVTPDGVSLRSTSKTYMYDFDMTSGEKTVLGKLSYPGDDFSHGDIAYSADGNVLYVLTGKALYTLDEGNMELTKIGEHGVNWASGLAITDDGKLYVSGREANSNAQVWQMNPDTAVATLVMEGPEHINDLTFVDNYCR